MKNSFFFYLAFIAFWKRALYLYIYTHIHSLATLLGTPCLYWIGLPFAFRTASFLCCIDSTRCWKFSSEILVHIDMIASRSCCRFVGCTSMMRISRFTTSQRCSIGSGLYRSGPNQALPEREREKGAHKIACNTTLIYITQNEYKY